MTSSISSYIRTQARVYAGLCHSPRKPVLLSVFQKLILLYQTGIFKMYSCLCLTIREFVFLLSNWYMFNLKDKVPCEDDQILIFLLATRTFWLNTSTFSSLSRSKFHSYPYFSFIIIYTLFCILCISQNHSRFFFSL